MPSVVRCTLWEQNSLTPQMSCAGWDGRLSLTVGIGTVDGAGSTKKGVTAEANLLGKLKLGMLHNSSA